MWSAGETAGLVFAYVTPLPPEIAGRHGCSTDQILLAETPRDNGEVWPLASVLLLVPVITAPANTWAETPAATCWARVIVKVPVVPVATNRPR